MTEVVGTTANDRTTVSLREIAGSYVVKLRYYAENRADFGIQFALTPEQEVGVRGFFGRVREEP